MRIDTVFLHQSLKWSLSVPVKKEEDIKEENQRDGHSRETRSEMDRERERGMKECSEKKGGRETDREDHSMGDSSKEVSWSSTSTTLIHSFLSSNHTFPEALVKDLFTGRFKQFWVRCFFISSSLRTSLKKNICEFYKCIGIYQDVFSLLFHVFIT